MDEAVKIREATPADYEAVARLTLSAYRALPTWVGDDYAAELADVAGRVAGGGTVLVAEDAGGVVVGSVTLVLPPSRWFEWVGTDGDCGFRMLAVDPAAQGRGIGPALVEECLHRARAAGRKRMIIGSTTWMTTAHRIYGRLGFVRRPDLDQQWGSITGWAFVVDL